MKEFGVELAANRSEKGLDFRNLHLLHVLGVRQQLWLVGHHLGRHAPDEGLWVVEIILVLVSLARLVGPTAVRVVIVGVRVCGIATIIIITFWVSLPLAASVLRLPGAVGVARLVVGVLPLVGSARLGEFGGLCIRRLKSRHRRGVAARVYLLEIHRFRGGLCCLLLVTGVVHHLCPVYVFAFRRAIAARGGGRRGSLRRWLSRLIHGLGLVRFLV